MGLIPLSFHHGALALACVPNAVPETSPRSASTISSVMPPVRFPTAPAPAVLSAGLWSIRSTTWLPLERLAELSVRRLQDEVDGQAVEIIVGLACAVLPTAPPAISAAAFESPERKVLDVSGSKARPATISGTWRVTSRVLVDDVRGKGTMPLQEQRGQGLGAQLRILVVFALEQQNLREHDSRAQPCGVRLSRVWPR